MGNRNQHHHPNSPEFQQPDRRRNSDLESAVRKLSENNHEIRDGVLYDTKRNSKFVFNALSYQSQNQKRYESLGKIVEQFIYGAMQDPSYCGGKKLVKRFLPFNARNDARNDFFFHSAHIKSCDKILILMHGSGVVRAGQWSRRLIMNENLEAGSMLPYIVKAHEFGYGVIAMNINQPYDHHSSHFRSPEQHFRYVWEHMIDKELPNKPVAVVTHSYGGSVVMTAAKEIRGFMERTFAVALTDCWVSDSPRVQQWLSECVCNWVTSSQQLGANARSNSICRTVSGGTTVHEETPWKAFSAIWSFLWELLSQQEYTQQPQQKHHQQQKQQTQEQQKKQHHHQQKPGTTFALSAQPKQTVADMARGDQSSKPPSRKNSLNSDLSSITQSKLSHNSSQISPSADRNRKEEANGRKSSFSRHFSKEEPPKNVPSRIRRSSSLGNLPLDSSSVYSKKVGLGSSLKTSYAASAAMEGRMKRMALEDKKQRCDSLQRSSQRYASSEGLSHKGPKKTGPDGDKKQRRDSLQRFASSKSLSHKDLKKVAQRENKRKLSQEGVHQKSTSSTPSTDDLKYSENNKRLKKSGCFLPFGNTLNKVKIFSKKNHDVKKHTVNERRNNPTKAYKLDPPYATD